MLCKNDIDTLIAVICSLLLILALCIVLLLCSLCLCYIAMYVLWACACISVLFCMAYVVPRVWCCQRFWFIHRVFHCDLVDRAISLALLYVFVNNIGFQIYF